VKEKKALFLHIIYIMKMNNIKKINAFIFSIFFSVFLASSPSPASEESLTLDQAGMAAFAAMNSARSAPFTEAVRLGLDPMTLIHDGLPLEIALLWRSGLWPFFDNARLRDVASSHCKDMLSRGYFSVITPEGLTARDLALAKGYPAGEVWMNFNVLALDFYLLPEEAGASLVDDMLYITIFDTRDFSPSILHPWLPEAGVSLCSGYTKIDNHVFYAYILNVVFARPSSDAPYPVQCGYFYRDADSNSHYDHGEGVSGLEIRDIADNHIATTGPSGEYCIGEPPYWNVIKICENYLYLTASPRAPILEDGSMVRADFEISGLPLDESCFIAPGK
jgi:hypothetical protein